VPNDASGELTLTIAFDSGPLAGRLTAETRLRVEKK
jgi:hypothetical protein